MTLMQNIMSRIGYIKSSDTESPCGCDVMIQDGKVLGNPYAEFMGGNLVLNDVQLEAAYEKISCVGSSIDLISNNMQMIEPVFFDNSKRDVYEYPTDRKLKKLRRLFEKPNSIMNRKRFSDRCVKDYIVHGVIYFAIVLSDSEIVSIKPIEYNLVTVNPDVANNRVGSYYINNAGNYDGNYIFNGTYYQKEGTSNIILAPFINPSTSASYLPASLLQGTGIEALLYWHGCFHNKSLLMNGARPSLIFLIKSLLNPKHREALREEIRIKHSGSNNAGSAMIIDGAAEKDVKQVSQNNKDMEFSTVLQAAEDAIYKRLGVNWVLGKNISSKDLPTGMELLYDMTICPWFQSIYNHLFDVFKYYNSGYEDYVIFYLEQDIPALSRRFLERMKAMPGMGIFTISERRKMYNFAPLGDERDDEMAVQSVKVVQTGASGTNETGFTKDKQE